MQFNKPEVKSPITPQQIEALGLTNYGEFERITRFNNAGGTTSNPIFIEVSLFRSPNYLKMEAVDKSRFEIVASILGTFPDIQHFKSACELAGIQF